jgi:hypothetical protein
VKKEDGEGERKGIHHSPNIAQFLLHHPDSFKICRMVESIASQEEQFDEVSCDVPTGYVEPSSKVGESKSLVDRTDMGHSITTVYYNTC